MKEYINDITILIYLYPIVLVICIMLSFFIEEIKNLKLYNNKWYKGKSWKKLKKG